MLVKLSEALLRRKELQERLKVLSQVKDRDMFYEVHGERVKVTEGLDELTARFPKVELNQVMEEYNLCAKQLRLVDAAIQNANWTTDVPVDDCVMADYKRS